MASAVGTNFHFKQFNFEFLDQIYLKGHFLSKTKKKKKKKKININVRFFMFEFIQVSNFKLNRQFYFFRQNFPKQSIFGLKQKKRSSATNSVYSISSFRTNFQIKKATLIFWTKFIQICRSKRGNVNITTGCCIFKLV